MTRKEEKEWEKGKRGGMGNEGGTGEDEEGTVEAEEEASDE